MFPYSTTHVTIELRELLASVDANGQPFNLWDFEYPSYYKGAEKTAFEQKVIDHFYFHQIGVETAARFKHNFKTRIREIMPYYIQMYKSVEIMEGIENPFDNVDIVETFEQESSDTSVGETSNTESGTTSSTESGTTSSTETGKTTIINTDTTETDTKTTLSGSETTTQNLSKSDEKTSDEDREHRFSNTPQGEIENIDSYLTEASKDSNTIEETVTTTGNETTEVERGDTTIVEGDTKSTLNGETNSTLTGTGENSRTASGENSRTVTGESSVENEGSVKHTLTRKGNQGVNTYAHDMIEFRQSFINVDMMIIGELRNLFLLVY